MSHEKEPKSQRKVTLLPIPVDDAFDWVAMDILGPFPAKGDGKMDAEFAAYGPPKIYSEIAKRLNKIAVTKNTQNRSSGVF